MDPEMVRQQRHEETLTVKAQENGGGAGFQAAAANIPLISRLFASPRTGTSLVPLPPREIVAVGAGRPRAAAHAGPKALVSPKALVAPKDLAGSKDLVVHKRRWRWTERGARKSQRLARETQYLARCAEPLALPPGRSRISIRRLEPPSAPKPARRWPFVLLTTGLLALALAQALNRLL